MRIACSMVLVLSIVLMSPCTTTADKEDKSEEVRLYTHGGYYKMSPAPVLHSDLTRIRIENVETVSDSKDRVFTKLTYKPCYGKIESKSYEFRKKHETQSISLLLLGDYTSKVKQGDILRMCFYPN